MCDLVEDWDHIPHMVDIESRAEHFPLLTMLVACVQGIQNADLLINAQKSIVLTCGGQETGPMGDHVHPNKQGECHARCTECPARRRLTEETRPLRRTRTVA